MSLDVKLVSTELFIFDFFLKVWDNDASVSFKAKDVGMKYMAYMIENGVIAESCMECIAEMGNIYIHYNSKIRDVRQSNIKVRTCKKF